MAKAKAADGQQANTLHMEEVPLDQLHAHPDNDYPIVEAELADLMDSIRRDGLAQLPLVRIVDSEYQIISGHRRVECFRRLSAQDPESYGKVPVNIVADCDDERALVLLEVTNLMTRQISPVERARHFERLWDAVPQLRRKEPELKGVRTSQIIADIITRETGQSISRASVDRVLAAGRRAKEVGELAKEFEDSLVENWRDEISRTEGFSPAVVKEIAAREGSVQEQLYADYKRDNLSPRQLEALLVRQAPKTDVDVERALDAVIKILRDVSAWHKTDGATIDRYRVDYIKKQLDKLGRNR